MEKFRSTSREIYEFEYFTRHRTAEASKDGICGYYNQDSTERWRFKCNLFNSTSGNNVLSAFSTNPKIVEEYFHYLMSEIGFKFHSCFEYYQSFFYII